MDQEKCNFYLREGSMNKKELEKICISTCFRFLDNELVYPRKFKDMSFMIIYPTDGYYLTEKQYVSIFEVIKKYLKDCYYISDIEFVDSFIKNEIFDDLGYAHKAYKQFNYNDYKNQDRLFENAIYDVNEIWGISIFQDYFAIICGDEKIIKEIKFNYSNSIDLQEFNNFLESTEITNKDYQNKLLELISNSK